MRDLLFLCHRLPFPPNKGEKIRAYHALQFLRQHFRVHLGTFLDYDEDAAHARQLATGCASSCFVRMPPHWARLSGVSALLRDEALSLSYFRNAALQRWVTKTLAEQRIDTCLAYSGPMAQYVPFSTPHGPLWRVLDLVDVDSEKWHGYADNKPWPLSGLYRREGRLLLEFERQAATEFDRVLLVSPAEAELFKRRAPESADKIDYYSNGVDSTYFAPLPAHPSPFGKAAAIVFTGAMDYEPNIDAVSWFAERVMPQLRTQHAALEFHIVGSRPAAAVRDLQRLPGIHVSGTVADVRPYLQHAALVVAPLRVARGIQNKVLEAMAMRKTVVASPQALEGITVAHGCEVLCANGGAEFISIICRQLHAPDASIGVAARLRILSDYRWRHNLQRLGRVLGVDAGQPAVAPAMERVR